MTQYMAVNTIHAKHFILTIHLKYFPVSVLWLETDTKPLDYFQIQIVKQTMWAAI